MLDNPEWMIRRDHAASLWFTALGGKAQPDFHIQDHGRYARRQKKSSKMRQAVRRKLFDLSAPVEAPAAGNAAARMAAAIPEAQGKPNF